VRLAAAALLALWWSLTASAAEVVDTRAGWRLDVPPAWTPVEDAGDGVLASFTHDPSDQLVVVTRVIGPTDAAADRDPAFFAALEAGVKKRWTSYRRLSLRHLTLGKRKVPALDLWFRATRDGKPLVVGARFLFFRGYALSALHEAPGKRRPPRRLLESFRPVDP
jgi:hypothetical protein